MINFLPLTFGRSNILIYPLFSSDAFQNGWDLVWDAGGKGLPSEIGWILYNGVHEQRSRCQSGFLRSNLWNPTQMQSFEKQKFGRLRSGLCVLEGAHGSLYRSTVHLPVIFDLIEMQCVIIG